MGAALHSLITDVTGGEAGEHEHGGLAGHGATRSLQGTDARHGGRVVLEWTIYEHLGTSFLHQLGGLADQVCIGALAAVHGAVAEHGDTARQAKGLSGVVALHGDSGKFFGGGVQVDSAVAVDVSLAGHAHKEHRAYGLDAGGALDNLQGRAQGVCGRMNSARHKAIHLAHLEHHGSKHHVVGKGGAGLVFGHALRLAEFHQGRHILFSHLCSRFDNLDIGGEFYALFLGHLENLILLADENGDGDLAVDHQLCSLHSAGFGTFGQNNALLGLRGLQQKPGAEHSLAGFAFSRFCSQFLGQALPACQQAVRAEQVGIFAVRENLSIQSRSKVIVELVGNGIGHAGSAFHHHGIHCGKILLQEIGGNLFHQHGRTMGLQLSGSLATVHAGLVDGRLETGGGHCVYHFFDFGLHRRFCDGHKNHSIHNNLRFTQNCKGP